MYISVNARVEKSELDGNQSAEAVKINYEKTMPQIELTKEAIGVCKTFLHAHGSCGRCPLVTTCHRRVIPLTQENLNKHANELNEAARKYIESTT